MKQVILLEAEDVATLKRGETITISAGGQDILLGYDRRQRAQRAAKTGDFPCPKCDKIFNSVPGVNMHIMRVHKRQGGTQKGAK